MRFLYTLILYLALPYILAHLMWRGIGNRAYWRRWGERFGGAARDAAKDCDLWLHAVSVGEVQAAVPLVNELLDRDPGLRILLTTGTPTGSDRVVHNLSGQVAHTYAPYDLPFAVRRFLERYRPRAAVFMETELWPNMIAQCAQRAIPVVIANARLSARSAAGYRRFRPLVAAMLADVDAIAAQSDQDAARFRALGMPAQRIHVTGSIKFDVRLPASIRERAEVIRRCWGVDRSVLLAASTHEGEDELVLDAFAQVLEVYPDGLLVLVPRHPERFGRVASLAEAAGHNVVRRSEKPVSCARAQVFVGDTMGELPVFYAASDVTFVGGSLVPTGGHNLLEPAALGVPILTGPHLFNFAQVSELLFRHQAALLVQSADEIAGQVIALFADANQRHAMGSRAKQVVEDNRGALQRLADLVADRLSAT